MKDISYSQVVEAEFLRANPENFGEARLTSPEFNSLGKLFREIGSREATLAHIKEFGYPTPEEVTPEMVAITGAAHACGVAIHLANERGVDGKDSTYESYTTKNRFDRFVRLHLPKELRKEWDEPLNRDPEVDNPKIVYPDGVDVNKIYGVAKPSRYLPAQTLRNLEFARLGRLDKATKKAMLIEDIDQTMLGIDWDEFIPVIESAENVIELSGAIGAKVAEKLLQSGLSIEQVAAVLKKSFSIRGIKEEHGNIEEADKVLESLKTSLANTDTTSAVADLLK